MGLPLVNQFLAQGYALVRILSALKIAQESINWTIFIQLIRRHWKYDCDYKN